MGLVEGVLEKGFNNCSREELKAAYIELFKMPPCKTCSGLDWFGIYNTIYRTYYKLTKVVLPPPSKSEKYYWNPDHANAIIYLQTATKRIPVNGNCRDQLVLQKLYNQYKGTKHEGLILINENYVEN